VLSRLGLPRSLPNDLVGLTRAYGAWCRNVPFDNVSKRVFFADPSGELPGGDATAFFESFLAHGTGGTCWSTSTALHALLSSLGFPARRAAGTMMMGNDPPPARLTHGTVLVRAGGRDHLVDTHMLTATPLPLVRGENTSVPGPFGARTEPGEPLGGLFRVFFQPWNGRPEMSCLLEREEVDAAFIRERHLLSRNSGPFNGQLYVRRHTPDGHALVVRGSHVAVSREGATTTTPMATRADRDARLAALGFSTAIIARIPDDEPLPPA
jgi:N-hydroxyarylamine O-acetyltransferase